ncbi:MULTISPECIES: thioredoxin [unclassified Sulfitobacter]|jgi:putative thioredoxin|uniref:thioredoxin n=1 Tax=unclassified Sulfitobacter TaxID=196795 RepID=UPI0007C27735|nr:MULTISPECIES: thioredoxin [unclassified Sulfitobacter]KZX99703.1 co-chaperone YbbN [Sulfitobacter sp. HI0023]KZY27470.1 co-chaperone YbbN [Sulfitobacter sp. HI0040]KZZ64040.1 co-chaperone YbbN [Sulfitobacter sp. HI0129]
MELNLSPAPDADLIKDGSEATFMTDVVEASQTTPVIVDFWAPWCGPCKTLGPMLEDAVRAAKGAVKMVKVNVDEAQQIAGQLQIQSIPTVYAFYKGQPVDGFQGALPQSELKAFVDRVVKAGGGEAPGDALADAVEAAEDMLANGAAADAAQTFAAILGEDDKHAGAYGGLVRAYIAMDDLEQAEAFLNGAPIEISKAPELEAAYAQLQLARQAANAGPVAELTAKVEAEPDNHQARFDLAQALYANGDAGGAVDHLLELFRKDRDWNDGAAKTQLFTIFDALKPNDPVVLNGRRKLSSMIFV